MEAANMDLVWSPAGKERDGVVLPRDRRGDGGRGPKTLNTMVLGLVPKLGGMAVVATLQFALRRRQRRNAVLASVLLSAPLAGPHLVLEPVCAVYVLRKLLRWAGHPAARQLAFLDRACPLLLDYLRTILRARGLRRRGEADGTDKSKEIATLWEERHEVGAAELHSILEDLGGFYLKVGQVFGIKQDLLPACYTRRLRTLFDQCKADEASYVAQVLSREFGRGDASELFASFDSAPLASATIAQVHLARSRTGQKLAVKVLHKGVRELMERDLANMIWFVELVQERLGLRFNVDQLSILREYREIVPAEFDFKSEVAYMERIGTRLRLSSSEAAGRVVTPTAVPELCGGKVITMTFLEGPTFAQILDEQERMRDFSGGGDPEPAERLNLESFRPQELLPCLLVAYGEQIFEEGVFHGDPHPGNLVWVRDQNEVGLIDFGECKELDDRTVGLLAKMTVALAAGGRETIADCLDATGVVVEGVANDFKATVATILFDCRMDLPEAHLSPFDENAPEEMRLVSVRTVPEDVFMVIRVVALLRGLMAAFSCDLSASRAWEPFARRALKRLGIPSPVPERGPTVGHHTAASPAPSSSSIRSIIRDMKLLARWMSQRGLPHDRLSLTPLAVHGVTNVRRLAELAMTKDPILDSALARFSREDQRRAKELAVEQEREGIWRDQARAKLQKLEGVQKTTKKKSFKSRLKRLFVSAS